uniref:RING-type domain-containing protein n=1 Tax=Kalanchoe fedtschenkoi TaxID=63787 RepID=A0A7N0RAG6_KALFE
MDLSEVAGSGSNVKDFSKKKRGNRYAKLKQTKLDARREQWLAQVKSKGSKEECENECQVSVDGRSKKGELDVKNVEVKRRGEERNGPTHHHNADWDISPSNSPGSLGSFFASNSSGTNFSGCCGSSVSSGGCNSGSITEEDEDNDGCFDDWEAVADALGVGDKSIEPSPEPPTVQQEPSRGVPCEGNSLGKGPRPESLKVPVNLGGCRAWKPDDAFRPQSLPNLAKQRSFHAKSDMHYDRGGCGSWVRNNVTSLPTSCPICYEDLDKTDTSFLPCLCGFRLCLFCHKRILEENGRCPGCRKPYETNGLVQEGKPNLNGGTSSTWLARSFSMITEPKK